MITGIYHNADFDGIACAAIMKEYGVDKLIGWDYHYNVEDLWEQLEGSDSVIMADISLDQESMNRLDKEYNFLWVDHHKNAIDVIEVSKSFLNVGTAACELLWTYLFNESVPRIIRFLGKYDTWRKEDEWHESFKYTWEEVLNFQYGLRAYRSEAMNIIQSRLRGGSLNEITKIGKGVLMYEEERKRRLVDNGFRGSIGDVKCLVLNCQSPVKIENELTVSYFYDGNRYRVSLRGKGAIDVAKSFGGGGHPEGAGFTSENLDFFN